MWNIDAIVAIARSAGEQIMAVYDEPSEVVEKADASPLTAADLASHRCIVAALAQLTPEIPVLSEESSGQETIERLRWSRYWLIDPLDGTKEFIKRNGEFTVNIALIDNNRPILGVVHAPARQVTYYGEVGQGAWKIDAQGSHRISVKSIPKADELWEVVGSRSHQSEEFKDFLTCFENVELVAMGSSLKLCLVAEGAADLYPRLGLTSEWDTAAAHAVVEAAGGQVLVYPSLQPLRYNTQADTLLNPWFIVCHSPASPWLERTLVARATRDTPYEHKAHDSKSTVVWNHTTISPELRATQKRQSTRCIWLTGLSGSGKSTLANALELELFKRGYHCMLLDGDNVRHGLCKDLGMSEQDRGENIRRVAEVSKLLTDAGLIVISAFISPYRADRDLARTLFADGDFIEVYVEAPLAVCEQRDPKGLYQRARNGEIKNFTGIDAIYELPLSPEFTASTHEQTVSQITSSIVKTFGFDGISS